MKRMMALLLMVGILVSVLPVGAFAEETTEATQAAVVRAPGQCGDDLTWSFDSGTLTVSGTGAMDDYTDGDAPWLEYKNSIEKLVFTGGVTGVGAYAFQDYDNLKAVAFGTAMHSIGKRAFYDCDSLTTFTLPATFRKFGEECFMSCDFLREIRCLGPMPSFRNSCLWDCPVSVFYPTTNPWPAEYVTPLCQSYQGKIQIFMGDGIEEAGKTAQPDETQLPVTEPAETVPQTTVPETTVPETTVAETIPETAVSATEAPETRPSEPEWLRETETQPREVQEEKGIGSSGLWFGLFLITGTLSLVLLGALIFRRRSY